MYTGNAKVLAGGGSGIDATDVPRVVRIEAHGFKSFAERVTLPLMGGITAVVGPNGTGKSNLTDAVLWAMGEQRLRHLRAERAEDLLFAGSATRRPAYAAECALTVTNPAGALGVDTAEVEVRRRLTRAGEMTYLVNRRPARLRDVEDILARAGLGAGGYAVVGQGQVDAVLRARPRERQRWLEDAAGIASLEAERARAVAALAQGEAERASLLARREELGRRLEDLRAEAARAAQDRRLAAEILALETGLLRGRLLQAEAARDAAIRAHQEAEARRSVLEAAGSRWIRVRSLLADLGEAIEGRLARVRAHGEAVRRARNGQEVARVRRAAERTALEREAEELAASLERALRQKAQAQAAAAQAAEGLPPLEAEAARLRARIEAGEAEAARAARQAAQQRAEELARRAHELDEQAVVARHEAETAQAALDGAVRRREDAQHAWDASREAASAARDAVRAAQALLEAARLERERARERWIRVQAERGGRHGSRGAELVLEAARRGVLEGVRGLLGELVKCPDDLERAIDSALGAAAEDVVVDRAAQAEAAVRYLRSQGGRATFLPLDVLRPRPIRPAPEAPGMRGVAADLVTYDPLVRLAVLHRLGGVWVVDTLDAALAIGRATGMSHRIVTLEGDLVQPGGAITGGAAPAGRVRSATTQAAQAALTAAEEALRVRLEAVTRAEAAWEAAREAAAERKDALVRAELQVENLRRARDAATARAQRAEAAVRALEAERAALVTPQDEAAAARADGGAATDATDPTATRSAAAEEGASWQALFERYRAVEAEVAARMTQRAVEERAAAAAAQEADAYAARLAAVRARLDAAAPLEDDAALRTLRSREVELSELEAQLARVGRTVQRLLRACEGEAQQCAVSAAALGAECEARSADVGRWADAAAELRRRLAADYGEAALSGPALGESEREASMRRLERLRRERAGLGPVWQGAADALAEAERRKEALDAEQEALETGRAALLALAESVRRRMETQVARTLETVRAAFAHTARALLKARGDLFTTEDGGLAVTLALAGKRRTDLTALSGGERALGALAFLFALMTVRPSALVVLDEVDAALDGHNAAAFARHLRALAAAQQFLVITHQRPVMEGAHALVGVTSREGGVTELVTVHLEGDWDGEVETVALR